MQVFFGDERFVPRDHPDSNAGAAYKKLLDRAPIPAEAIHPIRTDLGAPDVCAHDYERLIRTVCRIEEPGIPRLDLVLLGLGADGHTASLFPGSRLLEEKTRLVAADSIARLGGSRITFTLPLINQARLVLFLVAGKNKAAALRAAVDPAVKKRPPAGLVRPRAGGRLFWLVDRAAGGLLAAIRS